MIYGIYLNGAAALVEDARQNVIANNLANIETAGFKRDLAVFRARGNEASERDEFEINAVLDHLGGGVILDEVAYTTQTGSFIHTGNPLHVALAGDGLFAVTDGRETYYTRAGDFRRSGDGRLVTADGMFGVLDAGGKEVRVEGAADLEIDRRGSIAANGEPLGQLQIVGPFDTAHFEKVGENLYRWTGTGAPQPVRGEVHQYELEAARVDSIREMVALIQSFRSYETNMRMIQMQDETLARLVGDVGRVA